LSKPDLEVEPLRLDASRVDVTIWRIDSVRLPVAGRWHASVEILVSDFEKTSPPFSVVRPWPVDPYSGRLAAMQQSTLRADGCCARYFNVIGIGGIRVERRSRSMLQSLQYCARARPWIAMAAAYAIAIQMVLSAFAPSIAPVVEGDAFSVICQSGRSDDRDGGGNAPLQQTPGTCCTLVYGSPAILGPDQSALAALEAPVSHVVRRCDGHILAHFSSCSGYPRGPPRAVLAS
jgi:hypothetical protein